MAEILRLTRDEVSLMQAAVDVGGVIEVRRPAQGLDAARLIWSYGWFKHVRRNPSTNTYEITNAGRCVLAEYKNGSGR